MFSLVRTQTAQGTSKDTLMQHYRAYLMEQEHVAAAIDFVCADDAAAKVQVEGLLGNRDIELWQGARKVARLRVASAEGA